ncbi:prenyltransferase [Ignavigranum ruoffiae]|uniref:4-hydroxybenzoate polyprenyltransferase n=1 Tax=Ignavigranum ruoffiae TaxID=89093 RepID=A0A1H9DD43_9LACT|nr:prenyltransferase [Ignavigranum ruoffiae]SEQ11482.1 4-hydroxybenzoate polyprenyltransferase [Ignavigranum ruoffiae]
MIKRWQIYLKEMYPLGSRSLVAIIYFFEIYFVLLLNRGITQFQINGQEFVGAYTIFSFLLILRIADDFKDYETDLRLFPQRPLPSGRVKKVDLAVLLSLVVSTSFLLNLLYMNNLVFFLVLYAYGLAMSLWFFHKAQIQNSLPMALVTHNPVMMILNIYVLSFVCIKYHLSAFNWTTILLAFTMYFPSLIWEIARKIRAPEDETAYVTYSKLFGYQRVTRFVRTLTLIDICTNFILLWQISKWGVLALAINVIWMVWLFEKYLQNPSTFKLIDKVERYTMITEAIMVLSVFFYLLKGAI